jgi:hypothetical protein
MTAICAAMLMIWSASLPVKAAESRVKPFSLTCDGTTRTVIFNAPDLGASVARFIQATSIVVSNPRGGVNFLRLQAAGDSKKILLISGFNETTTRADYTASLFQTNTDAAGKVVFQLSGACRGGGTMTGFASITFFS